MQKLGFLVATVTLCGYAFAQQGAGTPQTARQALIDMFFGKTPGTFAQHLPDVTRAALDKAGSTSNLQQISMFSNMLQAQGKNVQTFETGSLLLSVEDPKDLQKFEITVDNDALRGDQDDIALTFHSYKSGNEEMSPFLPQMVFSMKQEAQVWKLNEISFTIHVPLTDPNFLKLITEKMKPPTATPMVSASRNGISGQAAGSDSMVLNAMRTILTAEIAYRASYPTIGYTCSLSDLDGFGGGQPNEHQAMLIDSGLASGKRYGYVLTLSGCNGSPANGFRLTAAPGANTMSQKMFCTDQSAVIRTNSATNPAACLASGVPVQ